MAETEGGSGLGLGGAVVGLLTALFTLAPLVTAPRGWASSLGAAVVGAAGLWFSWKAHKRAERAEARAEAAERRAAEELETQRTAQAKEAEQRRPVEQWVENMRAEHGPGVWFPIEAPEWDVAHAAERFGLAEVDVVHGPERLGRARVG